MKLSYIPLLASFGLVACGQAPSDAASDAPDLTKDNGEENTKVITASLGIIDVDAMGAQEAIANIEGLVILDIRTPDEYADGHIENAINIDFYAPDFKKQLAALNRTTPYLLYCRSGGRSGKALRMFRDMDFQSVIHLEGGILDWQEQGLPLTGE